MNTRDERMGSRKKEQQEKGALARVSKPSKLDVHVWRYGDATLR
jgi:hypothetical protein